MRAGDGRGEAGAVVAVVGVEGEDEESLGNINRTSESRPTTGARKASSKWVRGLRRVSALEIATLRPKIAATACHRADGGRSARRRPHQSPSVGRIVGGKFIIAPDWQTSRAG